MKVLFASSEVYPLSKTGGLADVAGALPKALRKLGLDVRIITPFYRRFISPDRFHLERTGIRFQISMGQKVETGEVWETWIGEVPVYLVDHPGFFDREQLYGTPEGDYPDNALRFGFFSRAILEVAQKVGFSPDIFHLNDWQTGLAPLYRRLYFAQSFPKSRFLITIHNLAYQGLFPPEVLASLAIPQEYFHMEALEFYGKVNFLKAGIVFSDAIGTVSPTYAREIQTPEFGFGLDGILRARSDRVFGILNGIDPEVWDPSTDPHIFRNYGVEDLEAGKAANKRGLQEEKGLPPEPDIPLIGVVSRLASQKGFDLVAQIAESLMERRVQLVFLGTGDREIQEMLQDVAARFPRQFSLTLAFDPVLARKIYAGSDFFLMPSRYEPCGLGQMIAFRYGTIPVVRKTGGLADTVVDFRGSLEDPGPRRGYGLVFEPYRPEALFEAVTRALEVYRRKEVWHRLRELAMTRDFSWDASAREYQALYWALQTNFASPTGGEERC